MNIFRNFSIFNKILVALVIVTSVAVGVISTVYYFAFKEALIQRTSDQLISINILKKIQVQDYLEQNRAPSIDFLEYVMQERTGMGNTGESYIVGDNFKLMTRSHFFPSQIPSTIRAQTWGVQQAISGESGASVYADYRGQPVIGAYGAIKIGQRKIALLSEMDFEEAMQPVYRIRMYFVLFGCAVLIVVTLVCIWLATLISSPIRNINFLINEISQGKLPEMMLAKPSGDEIGEMGYSLQKLVGELQKKTSFAQRIGEGRFEAQLQPISPADELGLALVKMREDLLRHQRADKKIARLRTVSILEGEEMERKRLAMDLHDGLGQLLTAIKFRVEALDENQPGKMEIRKILNDSMLEVKRISHNVMPSVLIDFGLRAGLKQLCHTVEKESGIAVQWRCDPEENIPIDFAIQICLYRIAQEACNNILKHAKATELKVSFSQNEQKIELKIHDNGIGFDAQQVQERKTMGLNNMKERAKLLNGEFTLTSRKDEGTTILIELPTAI